MNITYQDYLALKQQVAALERKWCCCEGTLEETLLSPPIDAPVGNDATVLINKTTGTIYYWNGSAWVVYGVAGLSSPPAYSSRAAAFAALGPLEWFKYENINLDGAVGGTVAITS